MKKRSALFALVCALVGLGAACAAAYTHYHLLYDPAYRSFCDVSERISCTQVYLSRYSTFRGMPVAIFGIIWFAAAALLSVTALTARDAVRESVPGYLFALSTLALSVDSAPWLRIARDPEGCLPVVSDHLRRGDRAVSGVRSGHIISYDHFASPRRS